VATPGPFDVAGHGDTELAFSRVKPKPTANPPNRFLSSTITYDGEAPLSKVELLEDTTRNIVAHNDSPDLSFRHSVNPYRGCNHGCAYCYARPGHEYLGLGAGTDFDTKIVVKRRAPELLRAAFDKPSWKGELVMFSGVTDCYQPVESQLKLTRGCLEVCAEYRNPVAVVTKSPLVERDVDVLERLHAEASVRVMVSVPIHDEAIARAIEPGVATPKRRLQAVERLALAGVPVGVMVAPFIPGVSEDGLEKILREAREAGATSAAYVLLRLPGAVKDVFQERVREALPLRADKILGLLKQTRGGALYDSRFGVRGKGEGTYADVIAQTFAATLKKLGYPERQPGERPFTFRRPVKPSAQLSLF